jgi:DNA-binding transcriptional ArsR family regulator
MKIELQKTFRGKNFDSGARCLRILGHAIRLELILTLSRGEQSVNDLARELGISQSNLSQHLALLKDREIIVSRRAGHQVFYGIDDRRILDFLALMEELFCRDRPSRTSKTYGKGTSDDARDMEKRG